MRAYLITFLLLLFWLISFEFSYDVETYSRAVLQFLSGGVSSWKGAFFIGWAILSVGLLLVNTKLKRNQPKQTKAEFWLVLAAIAAPAILNLGAYVYFCHLYDIGLTERVAAFYQGTISANGIGHTHILKGALALVLENIGLGPDAFIGDAGFPFLHLLPRWISWIALALFLFAGFTLLRVLVQLERRVVPTHRAAWVSLYIISSFAVWKSLLDGGALSAEFLIYLPILLLLVRFAERQPTPRFSILILVLALLCFGAHFYTAMPVTIRWWFRDGLMPLTFAIGIYLTALGLKIPRYIFPGILTLCIAGYGAREHFFAWELRYLDTPIRKDQDLYLLMNRPRDLSFPLLKRQGTSSVYHWRAAQNGTVRDILKPLRFPPAYRLLEIDGTTCDSKRNTIERGEILTSQSLNVGEPPSTDIFESFSIQTCETNARCKYKYTRVSNSCILDAWPVLVGVALAQRGIDQFILIKDRGKPLANID